MEFIFLLFIIPILFAGYKFVYEPFEDGTRKIDPLKRPTLARVQRILRAKNVKAREIEMKILERDRQKALTKELESSKDKFEKRLYADQTKHQNALTQFDAEFAEITRVEDERKAAEAKAEELRQFKLRKAAEEAKRKRELEIWQANEKIRLQKFKEQQAIENQRVQDERLAELARREREYADKQRYWSKPEPEMSYTQRRVGVHAVNLRKLPHTGTAKIGNLVQGEIVQVDGWITGEAHHGNDIWFRMQFTQKREDGYGYINRVGYIWSGSLTNTSTSGLPDLNEDTDEFVQKSASGEIVASYKTPRRIDTQIEEALRNKAITGAYSRLNESNELALDTLTELHKTPKRAEREALMLEELKEINQMIDNLPKKLNVPEKKPLMLTAPPKLNKIHTGMITADRIYVHPEEMFRTMDAIRYALNDLAGLSATELDNLHSRIRERFINTKPNLTRETVDLLNELAEANDAVDAEKSRRDAAIEALEGAKFFLDKNTEVKFGPVPKEYQPTGHWG